MTRRDHLLRIALTANRAQLEEPVTPLEGDEDEEDEEDDDERALSVKNDKIQRFDAAQNAILNAVGFLNEDMRKAEIEKHGRELFTVGSFSQIAINYLLPIPLSSLRNQTLVPFTPVLVSR